MKAVELRSGASLASPASLMFQHGHSHAVHLSHDRRVNERRMTERRAPKVLANACPFCESRNLTRSATRWWERPLRWVSPLVPFRCRTCGWRGWRQPDWVQMTDDDPESIGS